MVQPIEWYTANALWDVALEDKQTSRFKQPAILRFASDSFMEELEQLLATSPADLPDLVVRPETWRQPQAGWLAEDAPERDTPARLYQPSHGRFYLVAASLVCRQAGLPDKIVDSAAAESVSFVLRRLDPANEAQPIVPGNPDTYTEYGWCLKPQGPRWVAITSHSTVPREEERLPMFAMTYTLKNRKRRLRAGFLPVTSRETYQAGAKLNPLDIPDDQLENDPLGDQRQAQFNQRVYDTLTTLLEQIQEEGAPTVETAREVLLFSLVDLATFLQEHLKQVWEHIDQERSAWQGSNDEQEAVFEHLDNADFDTQSWAAAVKEAWEQKGEVLAGTAEAPDTPLVTDGMSIDDIIGAINDLNIETFRSLVETAIANTALETDESDDSDTAAVAEVPEVPKLDPAAGALYAVRCIYERPRCRGGKTTFVSDLSPTFQLASFYDPDAPGRPIRIAMPVDTSTEGLRKFPRNVSFLISNQLRNQMERVEGIKLEQLDNGEVNDEGGWTLGMICSLSIPIITICALILLMIIVFLLNIVFWWLPFFRICFPLILPSKK